MVSGVHVTASMLSRCVYILHTSTQVMCTCSAAPSAASGRSDTSLRRIYGPCWGVGRDASWARGSACAMIQQHRMRHGWLFLLHCAASVHVLESMRSRCCAWQARGQLWALHGLHGRRLARPRLRPSWPHVAYQVCCIRSHQQLFPHSMQCAGLAT